jgi:hypothetical protein
MIHARLQRRVFRQAVGGDQPPPFPHRLGFVFSQPDLLAVDLHIPCILFFPVPRLARDFHRLPPCKRAFGVPSPKTLNGNCMAEMTYGRSPHPSLGAWFLYFLT